MDYFMSVLDHSIIYHCLMPGIAIVNYSNIVHIHRLYTFVADEKSINQDTLLCYPVQQILQDSFTLLV